MRRGDRRLVIHDLDLGYGTRPQVEGYLKELETGATALEELRSAGTIKAFGAGCNFFTPNEQKCEEFARRIADIADLDFFLIAGGHYTLLDQQAIDVQFPIIESRDMRAVIGTPQSGGRLAGAGGKGSSGDENLDSIRRICEKFVRRSPPSPLLPRRPSCAVRAQRHAVQLRPAQPRGLCKTEARVWRRTCRWARLRCSSRSRTLTSPASSPAAPTAPRSARTRSMST